MQMVTWRYLLAPPSTIIHSKRMSDREHVAGARTRQSQPHRAGRTLTQIPRRTLLESPSQRSCPDGVLPSLRWII